MGGPTNDHLALIVHLDNQRWFVDVGFGDCCIHPLRVVAGETTAVPRRARIDLDDDGFTLTDLMPGVDGVSVWEPQPRVGFQPKVMATFDARSTYLQTEPGLSWTEKAFATRALDANGSRVTLRMDVLRQREGMSALRDTPVTPNEWSELLLRHFSLVDVTFR